MYNITKGNVVPIKATLVHDEEERIIAERGAHCTNHNSISIGVCYVGGCDKNMNAKDTRTDAQKRALLDLLKRLRTMYPQAKIYGHRDFANKACPCFDANSEYKNI